MSESDAARRFDLISHLLSEDELRDACAGNISHRQRIRVLLTLADLLAPEREAYADGMRLLVSNLNERDPQWTTVMGYDYCASIAASFLHAGQPVPPPLDAFLLDVLDGAIVRQERGPRKYVHDLRNGVILSAIYAALLTKDARMSATRNDSIVGGSACDLVAECLEQMGIPLSYRGVAAIWEEWQGMLSRSAAKQSPLFVSVLKNLLKHGPSTSSGDT